MMTILLTIMMLKTKWLNFSTTLYADSQVE